MAGILTRERIVAGPGFNRWLVPPAALAIHLSIGMAYGFSVFWLPLSRAVGITEPKPCPADDELLADSGRHRLRLEDQHAGLDVHAVLRVSRLLRGRVRPLAGARGAAEGGRGGGLLLGRRVHDLRAGRPPPPDLAALARLGRDRRLRAGAGLHLPRLHPDQVVPRPAGHGDRDGDHGLRRRGHDRRAAGRSADEALRDADLGRRVADVRDDGSIYFVAMLAGAFGYRVPPPDWTAGRAGRPASTRHGRHDHRAPRPRERGLEDAPVLAALGGALPQRERRDRRDRHGLADDPGDVRGPADRPAGMALKDLSRGAEGAAGDHRRRLRGPAQPLQHRRAGSSGRRCPTGSAASGPIRSSSRSGRRSTPPPPSPAGSGACRCSCSSSA